MLNVSDGFTVRVEAGNEIRVLSESELSPELILLISPVLNYSVPNPPEMTAQQINWFCKKSNNFYQAHSLKDGKTIPTYDDIYSSFDAETLPDPIEFILFPNPTTGASQAGIYLPELATVSITIIDVSGKIVGSPVQNVTLANGRNVQNLETESLQPGVYLVHLVVNGEKFVQRLVKQ